MDKFLLTALLFGAVVLGVLLGEAWDTYQVVQDTNRKVEDVTSVPGL